MNARLADTLAPLRSAFDLTPAEVKLAEALVANLTIEDFSGKSGLSLNTVRTHLKHLFAKTGTPRQAELVRLPMLTSPNF